jgi:hypothetical protein
VFVESEESKLCAEALLEFWYNYKKWVLQFFLFSVMFACVQRL